MPIQHQGNVLSDYFRVVACTTKAKDGDGYKMKLPIFYDNELTVLILENAIEDKKFLEEPWSFSAQPRRGNSNTTYNVNTLDEAWEDCEDAIERLDGGWKALQKPKLPKLKFQQKVSFSQLQVQLSLETSSQLSIEKFKW